MQFRNEKVTISNWKRLSRVGDQEWERVRQGIAVFYHKRSFAL